MPLFEYECEECGKTFDELMIRTDDVEPTKCKHCESEKIKKKFGSTSHRWTNKRWTGQD